MSGFKILGEQTIYKGPRAHLVVQDIQLPDGNVAKWDMIHHTGAAAVVAVDENGKLIMTRQYRSSIDGESLEIPAGVLDVEDGVKEDPKHCAARELEEETGYTCDNLEYLMTYCSSIGLCDEIITIYLARDLKPSHQKLDEGEYIDLERFSLEDLLEMIDKGELIDGKSIAGILAYDRILRRK